MQKETSLGIEIFVLTLRLVVKGWGAFSCCYCYCNGTKYRPLRGQQTCSHLLHHRSPIYMQRYA